MAMAGIREVLVYAENEKKSVTVTTANTSATGKVIRVNPLIVDQAEGEGVMVINFDAIQSVCVLEASGEEVVKACKPERETKFMGTPRL
jgi:hypothetical protein